MPITPDTYRNGSLRSNKKYYTGSFSEPIWPRPYDITDGNFTIANRGCVGITSSDWVNATNIEVKCGLVIGPANKTGGSDTPLVEPGSIWKRPVYMCASATKATFKTVRFTFNQTGTSGLERLAVSTVADKQYEELSDMPLWGIETPNMTLVHMDPFWGLVDPSVRNAVNLSTIRADHLYVPASSSSLLDDELAMDGGTSYMPGTRGPATIWEATYTGSSIINGLQDLSGKSNLALASRWKNMSMTAAGTAEIMNLIWTDVAANALIGTRGWLSEEDALPPNLQGSLRKREEGRSEKRSVQVPVHVYQRVVRYRWVCGIPVALCLMLAAIICLAARVAVASGKGSVGRMQHYLNRLSAGRLLAALKLGEHDYHSSRETWLAASGRKPVPLAGGGYESELAYEQLFVEAKHDGRPPLGQMFRRQGGQ